MSVSCAWHSRCWLRAVMKSACLAIVIVAASSLPAHAGYLGLGIGSAPAVNEDRDQLSADGRSGKLILGSRWSTVSVEGALGGYSVVRRLDPSRSAEAFGDVYQASAALKLNLPLGNGFEAFARVGLAHTWLRGRVDEANASGNGKLFGAGFEYRLSFIASASVFVDYQYNTTRLEGDRMEMDASYRMWSLGATFGL